MDKAPRINGDNQPVSGETADQASLDAMFELFVHYKDLGDHAESLRHAQ